ncbi:MAG TPA: TonB-dependent receptor [Terriglobales bacterium]|nr:TonB-dependent receptor [Terriglobales bacterium]
MSDATGARIAQAAVQAQRATGGPLHKTQTDSGGEFVLGFLPPGEYNVTAEAPGMNIEVRGKVRAEVGATVELAFTLKVSGTHETVNVTAEAPVVETQPAAGLTTVLQPLELDEVPLNGRRWQDLTLHTPGVTQDPRSLTSSSNGDLAFGGVRGYHSTFLVDGVDNNNAFFGQARGRYRAPYQISNEVVQEFRVSSNTYGVEFGRSSGAVINVVTKSGTNQLHGSAFYYFRSSDFGARNPFVDTKPSDQQNQFGFTLGGKVLKDRSYFYLAGDFHDYHTPILVRFLDGTSQLVPGPDDYERHDEAMVYAAAARLSHDVAGDFGSALLGDTAFAKLDYTISPKHTLSGRVNLSRYYGANNVFFDPASPLTNYGISNNGEEEVATESVSVALTSAVSNRLTSNLRVQFSRDNERSYANSGDPLVRINDVIEGFGRATILPRHTLEHKFQVAETLSLDTRRHTLKFGGDMIFSRITNFFPTTDGGEYIFDNLRVNPWTFQPATFGMRITPLRAYAHEVPRYYIQDFGALVAHPNTNEFSLFGQDNIRVGEHLAFTLGLRWDLQTYRVDNLQPNPYWPGSGQIPTDWNNFAPRVAFAYSIGTEKPVVIRGGYGIFYTRIPQIYTAAVETNNGLRQTHLFLDNMDFYDRAIFPTYPAPLVACAPEATHCDAPDWLAGKLEADLSTFARGFQTPYVQQASLTVEREMVDQIGLSLSYLYVHGTHLLRTRDVNLPTPDVYEYPVFDANGDFTGEYFPVDSFASWQTTPSLRCPFSPPYYSPPCLNDVVRPIPQLGAIDQFESAVSSVYHGMTVALRRRMKNGIFFRVAYTWARAMDDGQDAPFVAPPAVQNAAQPRKEYGVSTTDQRNRFVVAWVWAPQPFHRERPQLKALFNDWTIAGTVTFGSGRPFNARIVGDPNRDTNGSNDRLPGLPRNAFYGPDYASTDLRLTRRLYVRDRLTVDALVESFNVFNRANKRMNISDNDFQNAAGDFVVGDVPIGRDTYPASYQLKAGFLEPTNAYAPRQVQFGVKLRF